MGFDKTIGLRKIMGKHNVNKIFEDAHGVSSLSKGTCEYCGREQRLAYNLTAEQFLCEDCFMKIHRLYKGFLLEVKEWKRRKSC